MMSHQINNWCKDSQHSFSFDLDHLQDGKDHGEMKNHEQCDVS